jgi:inosose dehydratase
LGWTPDTGHLHVGGMDPVELIREYRELVNHIHLKDADDEGRWVKNGTGVIDMRAAVRSLVDSGFTGWVVVEDESEYAAAHPTLAVRDSARYVRERLAPLLERQMRQES